MPNKLSQFWQELKRRKVLRVITVYAAAAFVILQLVEILEPSLRLPEWTMNFILVLLIVGFIIAVILSWIYDVHPEGGVVKTEPVHKVEKEDVPVSSNSWKIASYISFVVIIGLLALNIFEKGDRVSMDESIEKSIAVLPFYNFSIDPDQEAMCLGLTDEIINHLFRIGSFEKVSSLTSVLSYRNSERNLPEIAEALGVNYILEGVYKKIDDRLTVSAQLIDPVNDNHIWQNEYNRKYSEISKIQADIALQIANQLKIEVSEKAKDNIETPYTDNEDAYEWYLLAMRLWEHGGAPVFDFSEAIKLDPDFALAQIYYARSHLRKSESEGYISSSILNISKQAIDKALRLDPELPEAHLALAEYYFYGYRDYQKALKHLKIAYKYKPTPECDYLRGDIYRRMGRWEESISEFEKAGEEGYNSKKTYWALGETYNCLGKYDESIDFFRALFNDGATGEYFLADYLGGISLLFTSLLRDGTTDNARDVFNLLRQYQYGSALNNSAHFALLGISDEFDLEWGINDSSQQGAYELFMYESYRSNLPPMPLMLEIFDGNYETALDLVPPYHRWLLNGQINSDKYYPRHLFLAYIYDLMGLSSQSQIQYDSARIELETKLEEFPNDHRIFGSLGISYAGLGEKEKAIELGKKATEIFPLSKDAYTGLFRIEELAWIYVMAKEYENAIDQLEILLSNPGPYSAQYLQLDPRWKPLWDRPEFIRLTEQYAEKNNPL